MVNPQKCLLRVYVVLINNTIKKKTPHQFDFNVFLIAIIAHTAVLHVGIFVLSTFIHI